MKTYSKENTTENAKKIVSILNELKFSNFTFCTLGSLTVKLRQEKCPYPAQVTAHLNRQKLVVERGSWFCFIDKNPFVYYNFISFVDRVKHKNNKYGKDSRDLVKKQSPELPVSRTALPKRSLWTRFWVKVLLNGRI